MKRGPHYDEQHSLRTDGTARRRAAPAIAQHRGRAALHAGRTARREAQRAAVPGAGIGRGRGVGPGARLCADGHLCRRVNAKFRVSSFKLRAKPRLAEAELETRNLKLATLEVFPQKPVPTGFLRYFSARFRDISSQTKAFKSAFSGVSLSR